MELLVSTLQAARLRLALPHFVMNPSVSLLRLLLPKHKVRGDRFTPPLHFGFISVPSYLVFREQINFCGQRVSSMEQVGNRMRINTQIKKGR